MQLLISSPGAEAATSFYDTEKKKTSQKDQDCRDLAAVFVSRNLLCREEIIRSSLEERKPLSLITQLGLSKLYQQQSTAGPVRLTQRTSSRESGTRLAERKIVLRHETSASTFNYPTGHFRPES